MKGRIPVFLLLLFDNIIMTNSKDKKEPIILTFAEDYFDTMNNIKRFCLAKDEKEGPKLSIKMW